MNRADDMAAPHGGAPVDLRAYLRPLWRWKWLIVLIVAIAAAGTYFLESRQPKQYVSSTEVYVAVADPAAGVGSAPPTTPPTPQDMANLATLLTDQETTAAAYKQLGLPLGSAGSVHASQLEGANSTPESFLVVTATSHSPALASRLANTYVSVFLASRRSAVAAQATADVAATQKSLSTLLNDPANAAERQALLTQESQLREAALNPTTGDQQTNPAVPPSAASSPRPLRDAVLGAVVGLLVAIVIAFGLELLDRRLVGVSAVESSYNLSVLAILPHVRDPTPMHDGRAIVPRAFIEPIRSLRINIGMAHGAKPPRTLLVTSGVAGEGKSTVVRDLALVCAEAGEAVLVIDADLRRPSIATLLGVEPPLGLVQVLRHEALFTQATVPVGPSGARDAGSNGSNGRAAAGKPHPRGSIDVLSYGERVPNPVGLLGSDAMSATLAAVRQRYDVVILDSAPLLVVADTVPLLDRVDAVLLVARLGLTTRDSADRLATLLLRVPAANLAGVVTNDVRDGFLSEGYRTYGYGYRSPARPAATARTD